MTDGDLRHIITIDGHVAYTACCETRGEFVYISRQSVKDVIDKFYSKRLHQSWKNVISIGDSPHERQALQQATLGSVCRKKMRCRTKTIKLKVRPQASELIQELVTLTANLEQLVCHDDSLDIVLLSSEHA